MAIESTQSTFGSFEGHFDANFTYNSLKPDKPSFCRVV